MCIITHVSFASLYMSFLFPPLLLVLRSCVDIFAGMGGFWGFGIGSRDWK